MKIIENKHEKSSSLQKICIRILSAPDLDLNQLFGSGYRSCEINRILSDPDLQQCLFVGSGSTFQLVWDLDLNF
jgi:hypothetical protein